MEVYPETTSVSKEAKKGSGGGGGVGGLITCLFPLPSPPLLFCSVCFLLPPLRSQVPGEGRTCSLGSDKTMSPVSIYSNTYI